MLRPLRRLFTNTPVFLNSETASTLQKSQLSNGVKIISESKRFPNSVSLGIVLQVGIRNDSDGFIDLYKDIFLRSRSPIDQKAYSTLELAGCDVNLVLDRETIYFHTTCLEEHLEVVLPALKQAIFYNKTRMDTVESQNRLKVYLEPEKSEDKIKHMILTAAYKGLTLGVRHPKTELGDLNYEKYCEFVDQHFTAEKVTVAACGIENHERFQEAVNKNFGLLPLGKIKNRPGVYKGGVLRENLETGIMTYYSLGFQGAGFNDKDMSALIVLKAIIGEGGGFSTGGPGKGMHSRAYTKILPHGFFESAKASNFSFTDSGIFSVSLVGLEKYCEYFPYVIVKEIADLLKIEQEELDRAKNIITREALINYQKTVSRLEDIAKNCAYFYQTPEEYGYLRRIGEVGIEDIRQVVIKLLKSEFSVFCETKESSKLPGLNEIYKKLGR